MKLVVNFCLALIAFLCNSSDRNLYVFDPRTLIENRINLSDISDDIKYIPFDNSFTFGEIYSYKILDNSIYVATKDIGIMEFDRQGKFIKKIGNMGRGPGEYYYFWKFDIDPKTKSVYILDVNVIKVFSKNGKYIRSIQLKSIDQEYFNDVCFYEDKLFISNYISGGQLNYSWLILDTTGLVLKKKKNPIPSFNTNMESTGGNYLFNKNIYYWEVYNDTIYSISPDLSYKASFLFNKGDYRWPKGMISGSFTQIQSTLSKFYKIILIFETNRCLLVNYSHNSQGSYALIDRKSKASYLINNPGENGNSCFLNDIDGGPNFQPLTYFMEKSEEYMVGLINPYQVKALVSSNEFKTATPKYPEKKKELVKLSNSLEETDNPVLMIVKLKK